MENKFRSEEFVDDISDELLLHGTTCLNRMITYF